MQRLVPLVVLMLSGCAGKWIKATCDGSPKRVPRDCEEHYETSVKTRMVDIGGEVSALAGVTVGGGFAVETEVTKLAQDYDQLTTQLMKAYVARCSTWPLDICAVDRDAELDWIDQVNDKFLAARQALVTAQATARGGRAGQAEVEQALKEQVGAAEAALAAVQTLLETAP